MLKYNYCTYLIVPLLNLDLNLFGQSNLVNCYLNHEEDRDMYSVFIEVADVDLIKVNFKTHANYVFSINTTEHTTLIKFYLDKRFNQDLEHYIKGEYSKFSDLTKIKITRFTIANKGKQCGTDSQGNKVYSYNPLYLATQIQEGSKEIIENELGVIIEPDKELWDKPKNEQYGKCS